MEQRNGSEELNKCMTDYWEFYLKGNPLFATYIGDHRFDDALENLSEESHAAQAAFFKKLLERVEKIDERQLDPQNGLSRMLLMNQLENHLMHYRFGSQYLPLDHMQGPHIDFPQLVEYHPFKTDRDLDNYISRLRAFPTLMDQVVANLVHGISRGITQFSKSIEYVISQVEELGRPEMDRHPLLSPADRLSDFFTAPEKEQIRKEIRDALSTNVVPAYQKLLGHIKQYASSCRQDPGIWSLPKGRDFYDFLVSYHTTTDLSPQEIHKMGKSEVERISAQIRNIIEKTGFSGSERDFAAGLKGKREFYPEDGSELLDGFRKILSRMDKRLPEFFERLPRAGYEIRAIEKYREQAAPSAYYYSPPMDFSRPGIFYVNTYLPEERPKFTMEALAYHEAVPGHHLQIAIMQEQPQLPDFRKHQGATSFIEGWALYAEKLSEEMGFYEDIYSLYGRLTYEIWRAVRLVVDTGLHFFRWSREDAIQYCWETTALDRHEIEVEVDRYAVMPGQALAYKLGEMKIIEIREKAKKAMGPAFDIRAFHDRLLENGALPLFALERIMSSWMTG